jgi:DNA-binding NarL/FixJ family response regulator/EAL domain-containing protein (putative c-di-GMP-specific phosphodiesterase class I)
MTTKEWLTVPEVASEGTTERARDRSPIRVLVADDEEAVVDVLRALVGSDPSLRFVGAANDAEAAIDLVLQERPDVVLLDVRMPGGGGLRAAREIAQRCPPTKIVALSAHDDADTVIAMIAAGAHGYVPKGDPTDKILRTIHRAAHGRRRPKRDDSDLMFVAPDASRRDDRGVNVARAIIDGAVTCEFAPIVDIDSGRTVGLEVQPRLATLPHRSYDAWCADAEAVGLLTDLELAAFREARGALRKLPEEIFLECELSPSTAAEGRFRRSIQKTVAERIVLGFSPAIGNGGVRVGDVRFAEALESLRAKGVRVSATHAGTGLEGLGHLTSLRPDFVRLDTTLTPMVDRSFPTHSVVAAAVSCAVQVGASVIAAGVTSEAQREEMARLGVHLVQGPLVGGSFPPSELSEHVGSWGLVASDSGGPEPMYHGDSASSSPTPGDDA